LHIVLIFLLSISFGRISASFGPLMVFFMSMCIMMNFRALFDKCNAASVDQISLKLCIMFILLYHLSSTALFRWNFFMQLINQILIFFCLDLLFFRQGCECLLMIYCLLWKRYYYYIALFPVPLVLMTDHQGGPEFIIQWMLAFCVPSMLSPLLVFYNAPSHCCSGTQSAWRKLHFAYTRCWFVVNLLLWNNAALILYVFLARSPLLFECTCICIFSFYFGLNDIDLLKYIFATCKCKFIYLFMQFKDGSLTHHLN
jgi:hypothetical protein